MKYLIKETTMEERRKIVEKALAISLTGAKKPSDEILLLANQYINGEKELAEIQKIVIEKYQKNGDN